MRRRWSDKELNMLKLWGRLSSINVRKVVLTAQLLGLPVQHPEHAHLRRWYQGLLQRPAAQGVLDLALS